MSRIGKKPVVLPKNVTATVTGHTIKVKGPKGELERSLPAAMKVVVEEGAVVVTRPSDENEHKALHGLTRTLVANMVEGVTTGFSKQLEIVGVGYKAETRPYGLQLALGFSHAMEYKAPKGIKLTRAAADADHHRGREQGDGRSGGGGDCAACVRRSRTRGRGSSTWASRSGGRPARRGPSKP